jgi:hypothetical protein
MIVIFLSLLSSHWSCCFLDLPMTFICQLPAKASPTACRFFCCSYSEGRIYEFLMFFVFKKKPTTGVQKGLQCLQGESADDGDNVFL